MKLKHIVETQLSHAPLQDVDLGKTKCEPRLSAGNDDKDSSIASQA